MIHDIDHVVLRRGEAEVFLERGDFYFLDGDLALYKISQKQTQKLGLRKAKLSPVAIGHNSGLMAQVVAFGYRSFGFLNCFEQFGYCCYGGSTLKGFSGAPYYLNKIVYGMHLGGSNDNLGYESAYLRSVLRPSKTIVKTHEGSDDWLLEQAEKGKEFTYERSPYDPDEYRIKLHGRYHMVDTETLHLMQARAEAKPRAEIAYDFESKPVEDLPLCPRGALNFKDSGNLMRAPAVVAGAPGKVPAQVSVQRPEEPILSQTAYISQAPSATYHTESLTLTPAQQNGVSKSTARNKRRQLKNQQLLNTIEQLSKRLSHMERGQPTSHQPPM